MFTSASWTLLALATALATEPPVHRQTDYGQLVVVEDHQAPLIWIRVVFPIGHHHTWGDRNDIELGWPVATRAAMWKTKSSARFHAWTTAEASGMDIFLLRATMDDMLEDAEDILLYRFDGVRIPPKAFKKQWTQLRSSPAAILDAELASVFFQQTDARYTDAHFPPGKLGMTGENLNAIRGELWSAQGRVVGVAGDITVDQAEALTGRLLSGREVGLLPEDPYPLSYLPLTPASLRPSGPIVVEHRGDVAMFAWARDGLGRGDPAIPAAVLAEEVILRGVERIVRSERGESYFVSSDGLVGIEAGVWTLMTSAAPLRADLHADAVRGFLARVASEGLEPAEITRARERIAARAALRTHSPEERLHAELSRLLLGRDPEAPSLLQQAMQVPDAEVETFARDFLSPDALIEFHVLPKELD